MTDYGKKMAVALQAVGQMHSDASKLLQDCDGTIGKGKVSIYGNYATRDLTYHVRAAHYMAQGVYRLYDASKEDPGLAEGLTIHFHDEPPSATEPTLIVGQIKYRLDADAPIKTVSNEWDLWNAFFHWSDKQSLEKVLSPVSDETKRIEWMKVIAVPLYSVDSMDVVVSLMDRVRNHVGIPTTDRE